MLIDRTKDVAEAIVIVKLPEGDYAAHGKISDTWMEAGDRRIGELTIVTLTMMPGEEIPVGGREIRIQKYESTHHDFNSAVKELIHQVQIRRQSNGFLVPQGEQLRRACALPTDNGRRVTVKGADGARIELPGMTMAIPIKSPKLDGRPIKIDEKLNAAFRLLAWPIEELGGRIVLYRPTLYSDELYEAEVESNQKA